MSQASTEFDSPWKDILEAYFKDFIQFFFPAVHTLVDWGAGHEFLDKELQQVVSATRNSGGVCWTNW